MTLNSLLFDESVNQTSFVIDADDTTPAVLTPSGVSFDIEALVSKRGNSDGGKVPTPYLPYFDATSRYVAKSFFKEHSPYHRDYSSEVLTTIPTYHFLKELRRQLAGDAASFEFSPAEQRLYDKFLLWQTDALVETGDTLIALQNLDQWLVDEITGATHPVVSQEYADTHPWVKTMNKVN